MLETDDQAFLAEFLRRRSGLILDSQKPRFAETRLSPVVRRFGFKNLPALVYALRFGHEALEVAVAEAMTVNDTAFFRDRKMFDELRDTVLPSLLEKRARSMHLRIWCAACASGQEPYSVAMLLKDIALAEAGWKIDLIATDLNADAVARAREGFYSAFEIQRGLSQRRLEQYFMIEQCGFRITDPLRRMVTFKPFNLLDSFGWLWPVDIVFCRNVLMYFDRKTRASVMDRIVDILAPDGVMITGAAESISPPDELCPCTQRVPGIYALYETKPGRRRKAG